MTVRRSAPAAGPAQAAEPAVAVAEEDRPLVIRMAAAEVSESFLTILDVTSNQRVVTVIELLSPSNKHGGGRRLYRQKQRQVLRSDAHLVELDLLRTGRHTVAVPEAIAQGKRPFDYLICVSRARRRREEFELYFRSLRRPLPPLSIPLAAGDPDVLLELQPVFDRTYEAGSYRRRIDYGEPCRPPLSAEDQAWADELIRRAGAVPEPGR